MYGIKKTIVKNIGNSVLIKTVDGIRVEKSFPEKKNKKYSLLERVLDDSYNILSLKGSKKVNLMILIAFRDHVQLPDINKIKKYEKTDKYQCFLLKILNRDVKELKKVFLNDRMLFKKIIFYLSIAECEIPDLKNEIDFVKDLDVQKVKTPKSKLKKFMKKYNEIIDNIICNKIEGPSVGSNSFYPEISIYNELLLTIDEPYAFDTNLFEQDFATLNERGVRDFAKIQLEECEMKKFYEFE